MANVGIEVKVDKRELKLFQALLDETPAGLREAIHDLMEDSLSFFVKKAKSLYRARVRDPKGSQADTIVGEVTKKIPITGRGSRSNVEGEAGVGTTADGKRAKDFWAQEFGADIRPIKAKVLAVPLTAQAWKWDSPWDADSFYAKTRWKSMILYGRHSAKERGVKLYRGSKFEQIAGGRGRGFSFLRDARDVTAERMEEAFNSALAKAKAFRDARRT